MAQGLNGIKALERKGNITYGRGCGAWGGKKRSPPGSACSALAEGKGGLSY